MQDSASFWTDIKKLEEQLAISPDSLCFARLSEVYLKVGLIDDAIHVARQGVKKHPRYLSGQRALSLACHAKGLNDEALAALSLVTEALPEDVTSQKLLGRLYSETGNKDAARKAFHTALEFAPDDAECRSELESLIRSTGGAGYHHEYGEDDEDLEEIEILGEYQPESEFQSGEAFAEPETPASQHHDPLSTGTLAELYVTQGFIHKALEIYRAILADNPADLVTAKRVAELEALETAPAEPDSGIGDIFGGDVEAEPVSGTAAETCHQETGTEPAGMFALEGQHAGADLFAVESASAVLPSEGAADNALEVLDGWLENIRRIKSCR